MELERSRGGGGGGGGADEDEAVMATNADATECKRCAVELGYWRDDYVQYFARRVERKPPEINRGYLARVTVVQRFLDLFLEHYGSNCQIVNLGCGFDTLYWRLKDSNHNVSNFIELDFPSVTAKKWSIIKRNKALLEKLDFDDSSPAGEGGGGGAAGAGARPAHGDVHARGYHLLGVDLRREEDVRRALTAATAAPAPAPAAPAGPAAPALLLAECVLVYLQPEPRARLLQLLAELFPDSMLLVYEQCGLDDKFGEMMLRNVSARGCRLHGAAGGAAAAAARLRAGGWAARAWRMAALWRGAAGPAVEPRDEPELLRQLHRHYALALGARGAVRPLLDRAPPAALSDDEADGDAH